MMPFGCAFIVLLYQAVATIRRIITAASRCRLSFSAGKFEGALVAAA